jgi:beta-glucosidase
MDFPEEITMRSAAVRADARSHGFDEALTRVRAGAAPEQAAQTLLGQLNTAEKLGLLDGDAPFWPAMFDIVRNGYNARPLVAGAVPRLGIPGIRWVDGPRGCAIPGSTCFPVTMARGATWDTELEERVGEAIGREIRAQGGNYSGCVVVNLLRHPGWGRAQETYGEDPVLLGAMGVAMTRGAQRQVMAAVKHYACNSIENARFTLDVQVDEATLHEVYLPHFREVVESGVAGISTAYNRVNGVYCGEHPELLDSIPRGEWGFRGIVSSDFVLGLRDPVGSLQAGLDVEMPVRQQRARALPAALTDGRLSMTEVDRSTLRILATQLRHLAALDPAEPPRSVVASAAHRALSREVAQRSMVLLRNAVVGEGPVLPLEAGRIRRVAVLGRLADQPNIGDHGSSDVHPPQVSTALDGLRAALPQAQLVYDSGGNLERATAIASDADACVVVVGYTGDDEGERFVPEAEQFRLFPPPANLPGMPQLLHWLARRVAQTGGDRRDLGLRPEDRRLLAAAAAANPRTIAVVVAGSAVLIDRKLREQLGALLLAWYPGMEGGHALADVLLGIVEPGGRLPFVIPEDADQLPYFDPDARAIAYDRWWGYRLLDRAGHTPAYAFGYGLGYTRFAFDSLVVTATDKGLQAELGVTNTGARDGSAVVQVYGGPADPDGGRPRRQLLGFARVELAAGATCRVRVNTSLRPLSRRIGTGHWSLPAGRYLIEAAQHAGDLQALAVELELGAGV